jgi:hypothetical protein
VCLPGGWEWGKLCVMEWTKIKETADHKWNNGVKREWDWSSPRQRICVFFPRQVKITEIIKSGDIDDKICIFTFSFYWIIMMRIDWR